MMSSSMMPVMIVIGIMVLWLLLLARLLVLLSLAILLAFHSPVLKPNFDLAFREVEVSGQFPALLLGHVSIE
jgi:hypothetical protein